MGLGIAYFAIQNTQLISITLANYPVSLPGYLLVFGAILVGLFVAFFFNLISSFSSYFALRGKDSKISQAERTIQSLRKENIRLQIENEKLRNKEVVQKKDTHYAPPSFIDRLRRSF